MNTILQYLADKTIVTLLICLGAGFLLGKIKTGRFPNNSTLGTILAAIAINLAIRAAGFQIDKDAYNMLKDLFFAFFTFALGYSAGPGFVSSLRRSGVKTVFRQVLLCVFYCACVFGVMLLITKTGLVDSKETANGLLAGAQTQSTILDKEMKGSGPMVAYAVCYVIGTLLMIVFVQRIAPAMMHTPLRGAVKKYLDHLSAGAPIANPGDEVIPTRLVQLRAYRVLEGAPLIGLTIDAVEERANRRMEVVALYRGEKALETLDQETVVQAGDVLVVVGDSRYIRDVPGDQIEETAEEQYLKAELKYADIVITEENGRLSRALTGQGVLLQGVQRRGRMLSPKQAGAIRRDDVIRVVGLSQSVNAIAGEFGYIKENGDASSIHAIALAIAAAAIIGGISFSAAKNVSLGTGCCAIIAGMICGVLNQRKPRRAYVPGAALTFMRTLGLNLFIAAVTLSSTMDPKAIFSLNTVWVMLCGVGVALVPLFLSFFFGRYALKLGPVELLGGLCGSGTCTAALNTLEEETESSAFTASYTPAYVAGNILLTLTGILLMQML